MTTFFKKSSLIFATILASALLFAEPSFSDYKGKDIGEKVPAWPSLLDKAAGTNASGILQYSSATKKLYKKLGVKNDKVLYYSIQEGGDNKSVSDKAQNAAKDFAAKDVLKSGQEILDQKIGEGKGKLSQPSGILGLAGAGDFWLEKAGDKSCKAYSVLQITSLNREEAAKNLAYTYMRENGYIKSADGSANER